MLRFTLTFGPGNGQSTPATSKAYTTSGTCTAYAPSTANRAMQLAPDVDASSFLTDQVTTCVTVVCYSPKSSIFGNGLTGSARESIKATEKGDEELIPRISTVIWQKTNIKTETFWSDQ